MYRLVELQEGFDGELANDEVIFMVLEGPMIIIACIALTVFHPGVCFRGRWAEANWSFGKGKVTVEGKKTGYSSSSVEETVGGYEMGARR